MTKERRTTDQLLYKMDRWTESIGKKVTEQPVFVRISRFKDPTEVARLVKYNNEYEIVFNKSFIERYRSKPKEIKKVIAHEVAHIVHPGCHTQEYRKIARRLGAGDRCVGRGRASKKV